MKKRALDFTIKRWRVRAFSPVWWLWMAFQIATGLMLSYAIAVALSAL